MRIFCARIWACCCVFPSAPENIHVCERVAVHLSSVLLAPCSSPARGASRDSDRRSRDMQAHASARGPRHPSHKSNHGPLLALACLHASWCVVADSHTRTVYRTIPHPLQMSQTRFHTHHERNALAPEDHGQRTFSGAGHLTTDKSDVRVPTPTSTVTRGQESSETGGWSFWSIVRGA